LLPVDELWKNEIWFASFDIPIMMKSGRIKVFPMEQSPSNDFVKFYIHNEVRAVHGLRLTMTIYGGVEVSLPYDNEKFLWSWNNGRFLDCLGMSIPYEITESVIPKRFVKSMSQFRDLVESYGSHLFLFGGTLLGRLPFHCVIEHLRFLFRAIDLVSFDLQYFESVLTQKE
uniref:F-box protein n=1 Tax=Anisakis simplex TaxID=6269 RepID=A0A0M3J3M9_ANISI